MRAQNPVWDALCSFYFRLETSGWERLPQETSLLIGNHSGGSLTMDAWTFVYAWWRRFGTERVLHATAHDVLMAAPGLGDYFRQVGVIPASREGVTAALSAGCDVIIWPGGEVDAMRNWRRRDEAVLGGRHGFVRQAIRSGVPIVPVASVGGHDTAFVLSEGRWIANGLDRVSGLKAKLRGSRLPIVLGVPFGLTIETIPTHLPLPAKIRTELLEPIEVDHDPERVRRSRSTSTRSTAKCIPRFSTEWIGSPPNAASRSSASFAVRGERRRLGEGGLNEDGASSRSASVAN